MVAVVAGAATDGGSSGYGGAGGRKRAHVDASRSTPTLDMFRSFRTKLDALNDHRERIVKTSRDITAESKKVIFTLHRITSTDTADKVFAEATTKLDEVRAKLHAVAADLCGADFHRFNRQITPGLQEFVEAVSFLYYLQTGELVTLEHVCGTYLTWDDGLSLPMTMEDFLLGLTDLTGELMRHSINAVGAGDTDRAFNVLDFIRTVAFAYRGISNQQVYGIRKKLEVMETSVQKIEKACYEVTVRGSEYPKEMIVKMLQSDGGGGGGGGADEDGGGSGGGGGDY